MNTVAMHLECNLNENVTLKQRPTTAPQLRRPIISNLSNQSVKCELINYVHVATFHHL